MVKKGLRSDIYHAIGRYATVNNKYLKNNTQKKEPSSFMHWDTNNLYGFIQNYNKLPIDGFKWRNDKSNFGKNFLKFYKNSDKEYIFEVWSRFWPFWEFTWFT